MGGCRREQRLETKVVGKEGDGGSRWDRDWGGRIGMASTKETRVVPEWKGENENEHNDGHKTDAGVYS